MSAFLKRSSQLALALLALLSFPLLAQEVDMTSPPGELLMTDPATTHAVEDEWIEEEASSAIEIAEFAAPKVGGMGAYSANEVNLPYDLWKSQPEKRALESLQSFPDAVNNVAISQLFYRLVAVEATNSEYTETILEERIAYLLKKGQWILAHQLIETLPQSMLSAVLEKQRFLLRVLSQKSYPTACKTANDKQVRSPEVFWQRFQILCLANQKEMAKAQLGLELLREQNNISPLFDELFQSVNHTTEVTAKLDVSDNEQLAWAILAKAQKVLAGNASHSIKIKALHQLHFMKESEQDGALNFVKLIVPKDDSPSIPNALLRLNKEKSNVRQALLAFGLRKSWEQPVLRELQDSLHNVQAESQVIELPLIWRETVLQLQEEKGQRLLALTTLISPFTQALHRYAISDLLFLVEELKVLGLPADAVAVTEEALLEAG